MLIFADKAKENAAAKMDDLPKDDEIELDK
jgi:hypothetical protein